MCCLISRATADRKEGDKMMGKTSRFPPVFEQTKVRGGLTTGCQNSIDATHGKCEPASFFKLFLIYFLFKGSFSVSSDLIDT